MTYQLHGIIGCDQVLGSAVHPEARVVDLASGFKMIPVTSRLFLALHGREDPEEGEVLFPRFERLTRTVADLACALSRRGLVAYVEAEFHGGTGGQAAVVWNQGAVVLGPIHDQDAIDQALRSLGVRADAHGPRPRDQGLDEFDTLGLGRERFTDDW